MKKKVLSMVLTSIMITGVATSCGNESKDNSTTAATTKAGETNQTTTGAGAGNSGNKVVIKYSQWNLGTEAENNLERRMIAEYVAQNPNVEIQIADNLELGANWISSVTTAAAGGQLPDVLPLTNIPLNLGNDWLSNIKGLVENDGEWDKIPRHLSESTEFGSGVWAIPSGYNLAGYFVNKNLFESENKAQPEFGYSFQEFETAVKGMSQLNKGIIGISLVDQIPEWYPATQDSNLGWYTWDGQKFNLNTKIFSDGMKIARDFSINGNAFSGLTESQRALIGSDGDGPAWDAGKTAIRWDGTYAITHMVNNLPFDVEFIGIPGSKSVIIPDYLGITKTAKNQEEVYKFVKWMTFGKDGFMKRMDIAEANSNITVNTLPLINDDELADRYFANVPVKGVREAFDASDANFVEAFKIVPGYIQARWEAPTGIKAGDVDNANMSQVIASCIRGELNIDDYAEQINKLANQIVEEGSVKIKEIAK